MRKCIRIFLFVALAAFAAGTIVHAANAAGMSAKMTFAVIDGADMGVCQDCPGGKGNMQPCDSACPSPILAVLPSDQPDRPGVETAIESPILQSVIGRIGPPDPYPPRFPTLS